MSYTNGNLLDIAIAYERILIYLPKMKFMRNIKIYINLIAILAISFVLKLPSLLTRNIGTSTLNFSSDISFKVAYLSAVSYGKAFNVFLYISIFLRDILTVIIEIIASVVLIITIVRFYKKKERISATREDYMAENVVDSEIIIFKKAALNNSKITLYMCIFSFFNQIIVFITLFSAIIFSEIVTFSLIYIFALLFLLRQSLNFFIFLKLNRKFKRNFIILLPNCLKAKFKGKNKKADKSNQTINKIISNKAYKCSEKIDAYDKKIFHIQVGANQNEYIKESSRKVYKFHIDNIITETHL